MWDFLSPVTLIELQRKAALGYMGEQARQLLRDGYPVEADRMLDLIIAQRAAWGGHAEPPA